MINTTEKETKKRNLKSFFLLLLFLILLSSLLAYAFFYFKEDTSTELFETIVIDEEEKLNITEGLKGEIYLTLAPLGTYSANVYKLDLSTMALEEIFPQSESRNYMASFSSENDKMLFVRTLQDETSQILISDMKTGDILEATSPLAPLPRNPVFSSNNETFAFWSYRSYLQNPFGFDLALEDHYIYISNIDSETEEITSGVYPKFSPNGEQILFMRTEGLYLIDLEEKEEQLVLKMSQKEEVSANYRWEWGWSYRFNVSNCGNYLITTDTLGPQENNNIYKIKSWKPFEIEKKINLNLSEPNWPTFSPDGKYLAVQEVFETSEDFLFEEIALVIYSLDFEEGSLEKMESFPLVEYEIENIWISDWITD